MPLFGNTSPQDMLIELVLIVVLAFMPALIYMVALRYVEKYEREPWGSMFNVFLWGATMGVVAVIIFRGMFYVHFADLYPELAEDRGYTELIAAVLITPIVAELIKPIGLLTVRDDIDESEDGLIYGAVAGLGYASTENLLFGIFIVSIYGMEYYIYIIIVRSVSVVLLNASTSALVGFGVSRATAKKHKTGTLWAFPIFLLIAIGMHAFFNLLMTSGDGISNLLSVSTSFLFAIGISLGFMVWIYFKIYLLDRLDEPEEEAKKEATQEEEMRRRRRPMPRDDYYYEDQRDHPQRRQMRRDDHYDAPPPAHHQQRTAYGQPPRVHHQQPIAHHPPPTAHHPPPTAHRPPPTAHRPPPRARRVGAVPQQPPPSIYVEQPVPQQARAQKWDDVPTKGGEVRDVEWGQPAKRGKRKEERGKAGKKKAEGSMEWEEDTEEAIDWEEVKEEKPAKPKKVPGGKQKNNDSVEWGDEDISEDDLNSVKTTNVKRKEGKKKEDEEFDDIFSDDKDDDEEDWW